MLQRFWSSFYCHKNEKLQHSLNRRKKNTCLFCSYMTCKVWAKQTKEPTNKQSIPQSTWEIAGYISVCMYLVGKWYYLEVLAEMLICRDIRLNWYWRFGYTWNLNSDTDFLSSVWLSLRPYGPGKFELVVETKINPDGKEKGLSKSLNPSLSVHLMK